MPLSLLIMSAVLGRCDLTQALKDSAKVGDVVISAVGRDLFEGEIVIAQHELGPIDAHQIQVVTKAHQSFRSENPRHMIGTQPEVASDAFARYWRLEILLNEEAERFVGASSLAWSTHLRRFESAEARMKQ